MNERKLKQLFESAGRETPPVLSDDFATRVLIELRREPEPVSLFDQLNLWFPKVAWASVAVIVLCVTGELALNLPSLSEGGAQISDQWLFAVN